MKTLSSHYYRAYSDYLFEARFFKYNISADGFYLEVVTAIQKHTDCRKYFTVRGCAYNASIENMQVRLRAGMYDIFLQDWLRVFPRNQIFVIRTEDMSRNETVVHAQVFEFLGLHPYKVIHSGGRKLQRNAKEKRVGNMLQKKRHLLKDFYKEHKEHLAKLLNYERFLWVRQPVNEY